MKLPSVQQGWSTHGEWSVHLGWKLEIAEDGNSMNNLQLSHQLCPTFTLLCRGFFSLSTHLDSSLLGSTPDMVATGLLNTCPSKRVNEWPCSRSCWYCLQAGHSLNPLSRPCKQSSSCYCCILWVMPSACPLSQPRPVWPKRAQAQQQQQLH